MNETLARRLYRLQKEHPYLFVGSVCVYLGIAGAMAYRTYSEANKKDLDATLNDVQSKSKDGIIRALEFQIASLEKDLSEARAAPIDSQTLIKSQSTAPLEERLTRMERSLTPLSVQEVLTVARLGDKFDAVHTDIAQIRSELSALEGRTDQRLKDTTSLMESQITRIVDMVKWVGLILIPLVLTMLRDLLPKRNAAAKDEKS